MQTSRSLVRHIAKHGTSTCRAKLTGYHTAQWHQWLRHTRFEPPSIQEQQHDVSRQEQMKYLAAKADERWNSVPSFLDAPDKQQPAPATDVKDPGGYVQQTEPTDKEGVRSAVGDAEEVEGSSKGKPKDEGRFKGRARDRQENPFNKPQRGNPGEGWQPDTWNPGVAARR